MFIGLLKLVGKERLSTLSVSLDPPKIALKEEAVVGDRGVGEGPSGQRNRQMFDQFWATFPNPRNKPRKFAQDVWDYLLVDVALFARIMSALEKFKRSRGWREGCIENAENWLKDMRWTDGFEGQKPVAPEDLFEQFWSGYLNPVGDRRHKARAIWMERDRGQDLLENILLHVRQGLPGVVRPGEHNQVPAWQYLEEGMWRMRTHFETRGGANE